MELKNTLTKTTEPPLMVSDSLSTSDKPNLCNDFITMESDYTGQFCINYPVQCVFGHALSDSNLLDKVEPWKEVIQPSKNPMSVGH